jgi:putative FmdB family regulatory protein
MPIYEYVCKECGHQFQKRMSFSESDSLPECPDCNSENTNKKISMFCAHGVTAGSGSSCSGCSGGSCSSCGGH